MEVTFTMEPPSGMWGTARRTRRVTWVKFAAISAASPLGDDVERRGAKNVPPALFTTTSMRP